jgi:hypothetical protein
MSPHPLMRTPPPPLTQPAAIGGCLALGSAYVLSLYLVETDLPRSHPSTIKRRIAAVSVATICAPLLLRCLASTAETGMLFAQPLLHHIGVQGGGQWEAALRPLLLNAMLFAGPLLQRALDGELLPTKEDVTEATSSLVRSSPPSVCVRVSLPPPL